jgi:hypothetical protein
MTLERVGELFVAGLAAGAGYLLIRETARHTLRPAAKRVAKKAKKWAAERRSGMTKEEFVLLRKQLRKEIRRAEKRAQKKAARKAARKAAKVALANGAKKKKAAPAAAVATT